MKRCMHCILLSHRSSLLDQINGAAAGTSIKPQFPRTSSLVEYITIHILGLLKIVLRLKVWKKSTIALRRNYVLFSTSHNIRLFHRLEER